MAVRDWTGLVLALCGAGLLWSALARRSRMLAAAGRGETAPPLHPSLAMMAEIGPSIVIFMLVVAGGQVALAFWMTDGGGIFSMLDLAGFVFLLVAYGTWVVLKSRYPDLRPRQASRPRQAFHPRPASRPRR